MANYDCPRFIRQEHKTTLSRVRASQLLHPAIHPHAASGSSVTIPFDFHLCIRRVIIHKAAKELLVILSIWMNEQRSHLSWWRRAHYNGTALQWVHGYERFTGSRTLPSQQIQKEHMAQIGNLTASWSYSLLSGDLQNTWRVWGS